MNASSALVLVCDGNPDVRVAVRSQLESAGFRVMEAEDGRRAYLLSVTHKPDIVLTELAVGGLWGLALIGKLRAMRPTSQIPVVVLSSNVGDRLAALRSGATEFIPKPWSGPHLCARLLTVLGRGRCQEARRSSSYHSCFWSFCDADDRFVSRLHDDLSLATIECWKWDENARAGTNLWDQIDAEIRDRGKVLLVASRTSLDRPAVKREIERALRIEDEERREVLVPIALDGFIFEEWQSGRRADVLGKMVADAQGWEENPAKYDSVRERLIKDLELPGEAP